MPLGREQQCDSGWSFSEWLKEKVNNGVCWGRTMCVNTHCQKTILKPRKGRKPGPSMEALIYHEPKREDELKHGFFPRVPTQRDQGFGV